ncbi:MAG: TonB family protein [Dokdonella sp.]|uniref:TonB family protein n=1 Tax=Dokdonella sp. TaxID=2291710 RepID=UPI003266DB11
MRDLIDKARTLATSKPKYSMRGAASTAQISIVLALIVLIGLVAWWFLGSSGAGPASTPAEPSTATSTSAPGASDNTAAVPEQDLSSDQLYKAARGAMGDNRMTAPAGNNALEYYLRILAKQPDDSGAKDALRELFPFATGAAEDQINQGNFDEAARIMNLLSKADPSNYTLTILRSRLDAKRKQSEREQQVAQQAATTAAAAAAAKAQGTSQTTAAAAAAATASSAAATGAADPTATTTPTTAAAPPRAEVARTAPPPASAPAPAPAPVGETRDVQVVTAPRPAYPPAAVRSRQDGWVEVEFTVGADGSVQNTKVVSSNPPRVFDREAVRAIEQAKFQPRLENGQAVASTLRRRIEFKLGN